MSEDNKTNEDIVVESNTGLTLGKKLSQAREGLGLSVGEVAERLKLSARQIEALEKDDYSNLPETVFVRGFLRSYSRFLNLDEAEVLADLDAALPNKKEDAKAEAGIQKAKAVKAPTKIAPKLVVAVILIVIIGVVVATQTKLFNTSKNESNTNNVPMGELVSPDTVSNDDVLVSSDISADQTLGSMASQESIPPQDTLVEAGGLTITTGYRSSLRVLDADGHELINKIVTGKAPQKIEGNAPFTVRIGYAKGAIVQYNNKDIDIASDVNNNTAEFIVPKQP